MRVFRDNIAQGHKLILWNWRLSFYSTSSELALLEFLYSRDVLSVFGLDHEFSLFSFVLLIPDKSLESYLLDSNVIDDGFVYFDPLLELYKIFGECKLFYYSQQSEFSLNFEPNSSLNKHFQYFMIVQRRFILFFILKVKHINLFVIITHTRWIHSLVQVKKLMWQFMTDFHLL